jgi:parallel beta-helix repeat protein
VTRPAPVYSGTAGVSVGDSAGARAHVAGNRIRGYNLGIFIRESRGGTVSGNTVSGTCTGVLVFDDSATEVPDTTRHVVGGDWKVTRNSSAANTRYCIAGRDGSQRVSGVGISITNADHVKVVNNAIKDNHPVVPAGQDPINYPPAGLNLVSFAPPPGTSPPGAEDPGLVSYIDVIGNYFADNQPVDIWVTRPIPGTLLLDPGPGIVFRDNQCTLSDPAEICAG